MDSDNPNLDSAPESRPLDPALRLEAVPFQPDGGCPLFGMILVLAFTIPAAIGLGWVLSWVRQWIYIIILFPIVAGLGVGFAGAIGVVAGKVRNGAFACLAGLLAGVVAVGSMHSYDYQRFLTQVRNVRPVPRQIDGLRVQPGDDNLGFFEYLDRKAQLGLTIHLRRRLEFNLGYAAAYIYWGVEGLIVAAVAMAIMFSLAIEPFCTACNTWKDKRVLGKLDLAPDTVREIFSQGEIIRLADLDLGKDEGHIHLTVWVCPKCQSEAPVDVKLDEVTKNEKGEDQTREVTYVTYPGQALPILESLFARSLAPAEEQPGEEPGEG